MSIQLLKIFRTNKSELDIVVTKDKMMNKYRKWKEVTSTSPSGRHLGHYHALFRPFKSETPEEKETLETQREDIIKVHFHMLKIAAIHEHVYKRWQQILTCMIQKDPGLAKVHQL